MKIFVGSSSEAVARGAVDKISQWIEEKGHQALAWNDPGTFKPGTYTLQVLQAITEEVDAAVFIFSEDDRVWYRGLERSQPRDNVILEYGMFVGRHGHHRAIICKDGHASQASDLLGLTYIDLQRIRTAKVNFLTWIESLEGEDNSHIANLVRCYPNKYAAPRSNDYWRKLPNSAHSQFILIGNSNKSWMTRDTAETSNLASDVIRILMGSGTVAIICDSRFISNTEMFLDNFVIPKVNEIDIAARRKIKKAIKNSLVCGTLDDCNYRGVLSDDLIVLIPNMLSQAFRDESVVFEIHKSRHPVEYAYYAQDMKRIATESAMTSIVEKVNHEIKA